MMRQNFPFLQPDIWLQQIFDSRAARSGGIVRRKVRDVERILGRAAFIAEIQRRGYHLVETSGQFIIFCHNDAVEIIC